MFFWRRPREIADSMISTCGFGTICTVWEVLHVHEWEVKSFWGIEQEMLLEVLKYGIKFL